MDAKAVLSRLKQHEAALRRRGVHHAAVFGSVARGDDRFDSDIDILLDLDPTARITIFDYAGLKDFINQLFPINVDVVDREALKPHLRKLTAQDLLYAF